MLGAWAEWAAPVFIVAMVGMGVVDRVVPGVAGVACSCVGRRGAQRQHGDVAGVAVHKAARAGRGVWRARPGQLWPMLLLRRRPRAPRVKPLADAVGRCVARGSGVCGWPASATPQAASGGPAVLLCWEVSPCDDWLSCGSLTKELDIVFLRGSKFSLPRRVKNGNGCVLRKNPPSWLLVPQDHNRKLEFPI
ncbi:hypothetical protein GGR56DRAFT_612035 [Xylariaceae sp. FL0804]|nr:hypothetical protein GGR56DRAFT_612035 [Xylariaceae sp. FL0804]